MYTIKSNGTEYNLPTSWEEVTVVSFINTQKIEDSLLPVLDRMKLFKTKHDEVLAELERLYFSDDEFKDLDIEAKKQEATRLEDEFNGLMSEYNRLSIDRLAAMLAVSKEELLQLTIADIERCQAIIGMLYDTKFQPYQPELINNGLWMCKTTVPAFRNQSIKTVYYCRHLAEYPACMHQVYHALIKKIRGLLEDARNERTEAELELVSLFLMPRPSHIIDYIIGDKPNKLDFDSGKFSELLNQFWDRQKEAISKLPITFLKGVIGFFLNHWEIYFKNLNRVLTTDIDMVMS